VATKKSTKKTSRKTVVKPITIRVERGYTLVEVRAAITPAIVKRLQAAHKLCKTATVLIDDEIPLKPPPRTI
jgi:hypothetical protein